MKENFIIPSKNVLLDVKFCPITHNTEMFWCQIDKMAKATEVALSMLHYPNKAKIMVVKQ